MSRFTVEDLAYFSGEDIIPPAAWLPLPDEPRSASKIRDQRIAGDIAANEKLGHDYTVALRTYETQKAARLEKLKNEMRVSYDIINASQFKFIWDEACWDKRQNGVGSTLWLKQVIDKFDELYMFAVKFVSVGDANFYTQFMGLPFMAPT